MGLLEKFWNIVCPPRCVACKREGAIVCDSCLAGLRRTNPECIVCAGRAPGHGRIPAGRTCVSCRSRSAIAVFLSPLSYRDHAVRRLVRAFKYDRILDIGAVAGECVCAWMRQQRIQFPEKSVMVPVPLSPARMRVRGFNQAYILADEIRGRTGHDVYSDVLVRPRSGLAQAKLSGPERRLNVAGAFSVSRPELIRERTVVLVDDVKTTGATLEQAAASLRQAGVRQIWAVTLAH